ncbi:hypothetical protein FEM33_01675 [Dyadobacter flavalbus]|uniref:Uncharacterized protein n=1 Tax=Dyadobacter flavalbus TaxID=2579942 RepID=A0A5M8R2C5_9BACT|nr:hypothetical protein [Dyadobacter flavalbus]KAA6441470.1 hypothetical protein FEM33_01675 [Dyadobacter flavalbus]
MGLTRGTSDVQIGDISEDGDVATEWTTIGKIYADSTAQLLDGDDTTKDFNSIQDDQPVDRDVTPGPTNITLSLMDLTAANLQLFFGGTVTGTTEANKVWTAPRQKPVIYKSLKIIPKKGKIITIVKAQISAKKNFNLQKDGLFLGDLNIAVLTPDKPEIGPYTIGPEV